MKKGVAIAALFVVVAMAALVQNAAGVECDPSQLQSCSGAILFGQSPTADCCRGLTEQQPCFCQYINNPQYKPLVDSPNARKVAAACGVTIPTTC